MTYKDVVYVDKEDNEIGSGSIDNAYVNGIVRRIARIIIQNSKNEILLQKRGNTVSYPYTWNDSVSGHVDVGETYEEAAFREMKEEMGIEGVKLGNVGKFYLDEDDDGKRLSFNTLFKGMYDGAVTIDPSEVAEFKWIRIDQLKSWLEKAPQDFTPGSIRCFNFFFERST